MPHCCREAASQLISEDKTSTLNKKRSHDHDQIFRSDTETETSTEFEKLEKTH